MWQPNGSQVLNQRAWVTGALYSESDFESTTTPIYAVAINWENQNNFNATTGNDQKWNAYSLDGIYKFKGFSANGMYTLANRRPETGAKFDSQGGFIQAGQLFSRRRYRGRRSATASSIPPTSRPSATTPVRFAASSATTTRVTA